MRHVTWDGQRTSNELFRAVQFLEGTDGLLLRPEERDEKTL